MRLLHPDWDEQRVSREVGTIHSEIGVTMGDPLDVPEDDMPAIPDNLEVGGATPDDVKKRADAMGAMIRAGVDPQSAAQIAGMGGARFTGGRPITLRYDDQE